MRRTYGGDVRATRAVGSVGAMHVGATHVGAMHVGVTYRCRAFSGCGGCGFGWGLGARTDLYPGSFTGPGIGVRGRRTIRLQTWNYGGRGTYFITCVSHARAPIFAEERNGKLVCTPAGDVVHASWNRIPQHFPGVTLDAFVVMPDHVHGILHVERLFDRAPPAGDRWTSSRPRGPDCRSLGAVIGSWKSASTREIRQLLRDSSWTARPVSRPVWQRNYFERIVRDGAMLVGVRRYIALNPVRWLTDRR